MNPWTQIWFKPSIVAAWLRDNKPLYGVLPILLMILAVSLLSFWYSAGNGRTVEQTSEINSTTSSTQADDLKAEHTLPALTTVVEMLLFPLIIITLLYGAGRWLGGVATVSNVVSVLAWSQLPIVVLTLVTVTAEILGYAANGPVLNNEINFSEGVITLTPTLPQLNLLAASHYFVSALFFVWSFQILLYSLATVESVKPKRALKILSIAFIALLLTQIVFSSLLGELNLMELSGLTEIIEIR